MATISKYSSFVFDEDNHRKDRQLKYIQPFLSKDSIRKCAVGVLTDYQDSSLENRITVNVFNDITGEEVEKIMPKGGFEAGNGLYAITFEFDDTEANWGYLQPFVRHRIEVREWGILVGKAYFLHYGNANGCTDGVIELMYKPTIINEAVKSSNNEIGCLKDDEFVFICDDNGNVKPIIFSCIGGFDKRASSFHSKVETFRDAGYNLNFLSGFNSETNRLFFGDEYGVPNDVGKKLSLIMSCDNVSVYNLNNKHSPTEIILSDSSDIERIELCEDYPFFVFAVSVEQRNHRQYTVWSRKPKQEEGLIFHLDVTNPACYSGSGSDIYDLTGNHEVRMASEPLFVNNSYFDCSNKQSPPIVIQTPDHYATDLYPKESGSLTICLYAGWHFLGADYQHLFETGYIIGDPDKIGLVAEVRNGRCTFNIVDDRGRGGWAIRPQDDLLSNYAWSWIIFVYDKNNKIMSIYDGYKINSSDTYFGAITGTQGKNFTLMSHMYSGCFAHFQKAKIYNRALSVAELEEMMANEG